MKTLPIDGRANRGNNLNVKILRFYSARGKFFGLRFAGWPVRLSLELPRRVRGPKIIFPPGSFSIKTQKIAPFQSLAHGYYSAAGSQALVPGPSRWCNRTPPPEPGAAGVYQGQGVDYVPMQ